MKRLIIGAKKLNKVFDCGKLFGDKKELRYVYEHSMLSSSKTTEFVKPSNTPSNTSSSHVAHTLRGYFFQKPTNQSEYKSKPNLYYFFWKLVGPKNIKTNLIQSVRGSKIKKPYKNEPNLTSLLLIHISFLNIF